MFFSRFDRVGHNWVGALCALSLEPLKLPLTVSRFVCGKVFSNYNFSLTGTSTRLITRDGSPRNVTYVEAFKELYVLYYVILKKCLRYDYASWYPEQNLIIDAVGRVTLIEAVVVYVDYDLTTQARRFGVGLLRNPKWSAVDGFFRKIINTIVPPEEKEKKRVFFEEYGIYPCGEF